MDPFTLALATFGVQKLRGKIYKKSIRDAAIVVGGSFAIGQAGGLGMGVGQGPAFSGLGFGKSAGASSFAQQRAASDLGTFAARGGGADLATTKAADATMKAATTEAGKKKGLSALLEKAKKNPIESLLIGSTILPLLGDEPEFKPPFTEEDYKREYKAQAEKLRGGFEPATNVMPSRAETFGSNMFYANQRGLLAAFTKYNQGGVNYLPSKVDHDENDVNNYVSKRLC